MHLKQDKIIEILDQAKSPEWHEAMISANIDIFDGFWRSKLTLFPHLESLEKICRTNVPAKKSPKMWCHYCDENNHNTTDCREITKAKQQKKAHSEAKYAPVKKALAFLFEEINALKKQLKPAKEVSPKKRNAESLLSTEINLTNIGDEVEEHFAIPSPVCRTSNEIVKLLTQPLSWWWASIWIMRNMWSERLEIQAPVAV